MDPVMMSKGAVLVVTAICKASHLCNIGGEDILLGVDEEGCLLLNGLDNLWVAVPC